MDDPVLVISTSVVFLLLLIVFLGRRKVYKTPSAWRKNVASSLWAVNAMIFGGVSDPVEKGKVVNIRKRDLDDGESEDKNEDESTP